MKSWMWNFNRIFVLIYQYFTGLTKQKNIQITCSRSIFTVGVSSSNSFNFFKIISKFLGFNFVSTTKAAFKKVSAAVLKFLGGDEYNLDFLLL